MDGFWCVNCFDPDFPQQDQISCLVLVGLHDLFSSTFPSYSHSEWMDVTFKCQAA